MKLCSIQNINTGNPNSIIRNPCSLWYNPMFIINLSKITWVAFHPKHQSINYFSQSIRNISNNFHFLIGFLRVNWNDMFTALVFWHSQRSKFYAYRILIIVTVMVSNPRLEFRNSETSHRCSLWKKTKDKRFLFCFTRIMLMF